tara:strand:+ start:315 stop:779 length:465 start_codon:yes stop_codon:yes gene_type:complete
MSLNKKLNKLFESKFKKVEEEEIEESNSIGAGEAYDTPKAFKTCSCGGAGECKCKSKEVKNESAFKSISKQMFLGEVNYKEYKTDESLSQRQKVNKSIKEVNGKLFRIERIIDQNIKLKTESGIDESKYWESTKRNLLKIEGKMTRLAEKLRSF